MGELKSEYLSLLLSANSTMSAIALGLGSVQQNGEDLKELARVQNEKKRRDCSFDLTLLMVESSQDM